MLPCCGFLLSALAVFSLLKYVVRAFNRKDSRKQMKHLTMHMKSEAFCVKVQTKYIQAVPDSLTIDFSDNGRTEPGKHSSSMKSSGFSDQIFINSIINMEGGGWCCG